MLWIRTIKFSQKRNATLCKSYNFSSNPFSSRNWGIRLDLSSFLAPQILKQVQEPYVQHRIHPWKVTWRSRLCAQPRGRYIRRHPERSRSEWRTISAAASVAVLSLLVEWTKIAAEDWIEPRGTGKRMHSATKRRIDQFRDSSMVLAKMVVDFESWNE